MRTISRTKRALRRAMTNALRAIDPALHRAECARIVRLASEMPAFAAAQTVLLYVSAFPEEVPTQALLDLCLARSQRVILPRVDRDATCLRLHHITDPRRQLHPGCMNILEPTPETPQVSSFEVDWAWIPGLAFDPSGARLGRGGGYYDRLLPLLNPSTPRWALALTEQCVARLPVEPHDQRIDGVVAPDGLRESRFGTRPIS